MSWVNLQNFQIATSTDVDCRQMWKIYHKFTHQANSHFFDLCTKNYLFWTLFMEYFQHIKDFWTTLLCNNLMCWVTKHQHVASMSWNTSMNRLFTQTCHFSKKDKKWLSCLNNLFMVSFQLIRMSSYAKNKQQMCWVTQHQCRSRQIWKIFTNSPRALTFEMTRLDWTIYSL